MESVTLARNLVLWPVEKLKPYERNARTHSEEQVEQIAASIATFGFTNPVLVDSEQGIIAGHGRVMAAKRLGLAEVPVVVLDHLTDTQRRAYIIADNKLALNAGWDDAILSEEIRALEAEDFDLDLLGFSYEELLPLTRDAEVFAPQSDEDEVPESLPSPKVVRGEVYTLGKHRLMCGDSTEITDVERLMNRETADMIWTDPPYNVAVVGGRHDPRDKKNFGKGPKILNDSMSEEDFREFLAESFACMYAVSKAGSPIYVAHADTQGVAFRTALISSGFLLKQCLIWVKQQFVFGRSDYHWQHEPILYGWKDGAGHKFYGERNQGTTWKIDRPMRSEKEHPTQKPVELVEKAITNSSTIGDLLFEPFGGGGSTLVAAEKTGRRSYVMELDPKYCGLILDRWQKYTGKKAFREDGKAWDEIRAE